MIDLSSQLSWDESVARATLGRHGYDTVRWSNYDIKVYFRCNTQGQSFSIYAYHGTAEYTTSLIIDAWNRQLQVSHRTSRYSWSRVSVQPGHVV